jgi:serine/threonine-protein kinase RsbW
MRKVIVIYFERKSDGLQVRILDEGRGFIPEKLPDPTLPENLFKDSGRGIHVMRHLMDRLDIRPYERGTEVVLFKLKLEGTH